MIGVIGNVLMLESVVYMLLEVLKGRGDKWWC